MLVVDMKSMTFLSAIVKDPVQLKNTYYKSKLVSDYDKIFYERPIKIKTLKCSKRFRLLPNKMRNT